MDYKKTGHDVFQAVGGNDNVTAVTHCATRLRFHLQNAEKVKQSEVEKIPGVLKCVYANGEMQVVIGPNVTVAYEGVQENIPEQEQLQRNPNPIKVGSSVFWD